MTEIILNNVSLNYPIYGNSSRSLKRDLVRVVTRKKPDTNAGESLSCVNALKNVSFSLAKGDHLGLIGGNGAGKSTLLKVLGGIYEATMGELRVQGSVSTLLGSSVGMQLELTGYENIKISSVIKGYSKSEIKKITQDVEIFSELGKFLSLPVKTYSAGMQARLAFGISTAINPDILLIDEVIGAGDAHFMNKAKARLDSLLAQANILVLASHSTDIIKQFCNKLLWLNKGEVMAFGDMDSVMEQYLATV